MSAQLPNNFGTFVAGEALAINRRVKLSAGNVVYADTDEGYIGITQAPAASGDPVTIRFRRSPGTFLMTASEAITANDPVYEDDDGKVAATGASLVGYAREAATADGDQIEIIPDANENAPGASTVSAAMLADAVADKIFSTTVAVANTGTPDGVAHITGQVQDAQGNSLSGSFLIYVSIDDTILTAPTDLGTATALTNSLILKVLDTDATLLVRTHTDGSWGVELDTAADGNVAATAAVLGKFATATAAITGN